MDVFWKRKELFYFILSTFLVFLHNTGVGIYTQNGIEFSGVITTAGKFLNLAIPMLGGANRS